MQFLYLFHYERQFEFKIYGAVACSWCSEVKIELPHDCFACHNFCYRISIRHSDLWTKGKLKTNDNLLWKNDCEKRYWNGKCLVNPIHFARKIKIEIAMQLRIVYIQLVCDPVLTIPKRQSQRSFFLFWREEKSLPNFTRSVNLQRV